MLQLSNWVHGQNFFWGVIVAGGLYLPCLAYGWRQGMLTWADLVRYLVTLPLAFIFGLYCAFEFGRGMEYGKIVATGTAPFIVVFRVLNDCARHSMSERFVSKFAAYAATLAGLAYAAALPVDIAFAHWVIGDISAVGGAQEKDGLLWASLWFAIGGSAVYGFAYLRDKPRRGIPRDTSVHNWRIPCRTLVDD